MAQGTVPLGHKEETHMKKEMSVSLALLPILAIIITASLSVFSWKAGMHFPLIFGIIVAAIIYIVCGWKWEEIKQ